MFPVKLETPSGKVYVPEAEVPPAFYRVLKDGEQNPVPDRAWLQDSGHVAHMLPAVNPMRKVNENGVITDRSGEVRTILTQGWFDCFASFNTEQGAYYLFKPDTGLFNGGTDKGLEQLLMADNIVGVLEQRSSDGHLWGRIDTYNINDAPPTEPLSWRRQRFTIIKDDLMTVVDPPPGPIYYVLVSHLPLWFRMDKLQRL